MLRFLLVLGLVSGATSAAFPASKAEKKCDSLNFKVPPVSEEPGVPVSGCRPPYIERFFHHAGLVLLLPCIDKLTAGLGEGAGICRQLLGQFLLGALNLERGKTVSKEIFHLFFGIGKSHIQGMRDFIHEISTLDFRLKLAGRNGELVRNCLFRQRKFYYDPHSKKYTGFLSILSGWCGSEHETAKVLISDYIHSLDGCPCFVEHYDNLYDLRTRFFFTVAIFKRLFPENLRSGFTWVVDRAIYSLDTLDNIVASGDHLITWEKGYLRDGWKANAPSETLIMRIPRNSSKDLQTYRCFYQAHKWERGPRFRKIIVRIVNPSGNTIEVSILSSNCEIHDSDVISYMLRRWLQENDFRYLIKHYGIDQIDSYRSYDYRELEDQEKARDYLKSRHINQSSIDTFFLGYSPNRWDNLFKFLTKKGYPAELIEQAGLAIKRIPNTEYRILNENQKNQRSPIQNSEFSIQ